MESVKLTTKPRPGHGSRGAKKLRKDGLIPAVIYGHKEAVIPVALDRKEVETALRHNTRVVDLQLPSGPETAVIQDVHYDHLGSFVMHVDFKPATPHHPAKMTVPIQINGPPPGLPAPPILQPP